MEFVFEKIDHILKKPYLYYAHKNKRKNGEIMWETLEEHTLRCQKYFQCIYKNKYINKKISSFFDLYMSDSSKEAKVLAMNMWWNIVTFHDVGKHNPKFQNGVLGRKDIEVSEEYQVVDGEHSALSVMLYLDYFYKRIKHMHKADVNNLCALAIVNAYIIARHHGSLITLEDFVTSLEEGGRNYKLLKIYQDKTNDVCLTEFQLNTNIVMQMVQRQRDKTESQTRKQSIWKYFYGKLTYSMLVAADYYATTEFMNGFEVQDLGEINDICGIFQKYQNTDVNQEIRKYEKMIYPMKKIELQKETNINVLRNEMFLDAERKLLREIDKHIFYLEAPTGSGKSNICFNLSFQIAMKDKEINKIFYIYPFNTLVEQNQESLQKVFGYHTEIINQIAVVNSITPIKCVKKERAYAEKKETEEYYSKALLNRQFLNYPIVLTTHVSLFDTIFGNSKESTFGFHQLVGSVLVLDEIQSYNNAIWEEITICLSELAEFMHMKLIIMSATLPDFEVFKEKRENTVRLIRDGKKYFNHPCFQGRVQISKELLGKKINLEELYRHIKMQGMEQKILVEFITKEHAEEFYQMLKKKQTCGEINTTVLCMTGDDSVFERKITIDKIKEKKIILVATQVVEAGLDIDMDIGYKNFSKMDSEEQFLGRINRSCTYGRQGLAYFFELDEPKSIYKNDMRSETNFLINKENIWDMLVQKDFRNYYALILQEMKKNSSMMLGNFFKENLKFLDFPKICQHMKLIQDKNWNMSVFLARKILDENGNLIDGNEVWEEYKVLLKDRGMEYAEKSVRLSKIRVKMNYFIYEVRQNNEIFYNDQIGELFYIEEGERFFENGRLNRKKIEGQIGDYFI